MSDVWEAAVALNDPVEPLTLAHRCPYLIMSILYQIQRLAQTIPVLIIFTIVLWSYYAFVVSLCGVLPKPELKTFYLIVFHLVFVIFVFSYLRAIFSDPGGVPPQFYLTAAERDGLDRYVERLNKITTN